MNAMRPALFAPHLLDLRRQRADRIAMADADFLVRQAAEEMADRLAVTNRTFTHAVDLATPSSALRERIGTARPGMKMTVIDKVGVDGNLGLGDQSVDLVFSALGLHRVEDLPGILAQVRRALKPDGLFLAAIPAEGTLRELRQAMIAAETALRGGAASRVDSFAEVRQLGALLQRAGFALPVADMQRLDLSYRDTRALITDLRAMGATAAPAHKPPALPKGIGLALENEYRRLSGCMSGRIPASFNLVYLTGWAPHESQQKPLRPGSARARLEEALKPRE